MDLVGISTVSRQTSVDVVDKVGAWAVACSVGVVNATNDEVPGVQALRQDSRSRSSWRWAS